MVHLHGKDDQQILLFVVICNCFMYAQYCAVLYLFLVTCAFCAQQLQLSQTLIIYVHTLLPTHKILTCKRRCCFFQTGFIICHVYQVYDIIQFVRTRSI